MSSHDGDPLARAIAASRKESDVAPEDVRRVRRRVLETLARSEAKPRRISPWVLPLAATLAATSALAATGTLTAAVHAIKGVWDAPPATGPDAGKPVTLPQVSPAMSIRMPSVDPLQVEAPAEAPASALESRTPPAVAAASAGERRAVSPPPPRRDVPSVPTAETTRTLRPSEERAEATAAADPQEAPERAELDQYRAAHGLHFGAHDYARALDSWDAYLAAYPSGAFALEARYNRSICLFKLGRMTEARAALRPFAEGEVPGGYRKNEARALIEAADTK